MWVDRALSGISRGMVFRPHGIRSRKKDKKQNSYATCVHGETEV